MTLIAGFVLVRRTSDAAADPVHVLVRFGAVLREVDPRAEHPADVGVPLVEPLLHDGIDEGRPVEEHPLARLVSVLLGYFLPPVNVPFPQLTVLDFLHPDDVVSSEVTAGVAIVPVLSYRGLHFFFDGKKLFVVGKQINQKCARVRC